MASEVLTLRMVWEPVA
ncbi:hypothetical protein AZE42_08749 [Rhizopogon vesiculosus]|uniref:Uncharacterized protein n=1 Tax=Rhizopogon vesiculosus TaxID=180088 RepID=A0A1J8PJJ2_9AGAM|nr:hypothetical protein AZE42_08749 [Rhizopogon vesiculosus]